MGVLMKGQEGAGEWEIMPVSCSVRVLQAHAGETTATLTLLYFILKS